MNNNFISILSDTTMKYLMKEERTRNIYLELFSHIIGIDLSNYKIIDNELNSGNKRKDYRLDLLLEEGDIIVNVEINKSMENYTTVKNLTYAFRLAGSRLEQGEKYTTKEVIQISLNNDKFEHDDTVLEYELMNRKYNLVKNGIKIYDVYLVNYKDICYTGANEDEMLLSMLTAQTDEELKKITGNSKKGLAIMDEIEKLKLNDEFNAWYNAEKVEEKCRNSAYSEGYSEGYTKGADNGIIVGKTETKLEIAESLLNTDMSINEISKHTGLTISELEEISNNKNFIND